MPEDDRAFATRLARYWARNPVALERVTYDRAAQAVTYRSDKADGPTAGPETVDPLEVLARVLVHIPEKGHVTTRYSGWYANRPRGMQRQELPATAAGPPAIVRAPRLAPTEPTRRWAETLRPTSSRRSVRSTRSRARRSRARRGSSPSSRRRQSSTGSSPTSALARRLRPTPRGAPHRPWPPRAGARHAPHARPPTPKLSPEAAPPDAPRPRGAARRARPFHRRGSWVPAGCSHAP